jgi:extracellular factor (EF) 3-hydroxypalmitic acid methyl ester biosynthesis protein
MDILGIETDDSVSGGKNAEGSFNGRLIRLTRLTAVFDIYDPTPPIRLSQTFPSLQIHAGGKLAYEGQGTVTSLVDEGGCHRVEAQLDPSLFTVEYLAALSSEQPYDILFRNFLEDRQRARRISPEFKIVVADLVSFLSDLQGWTDQMELAASSPTAKSSSSWRRDVARSVAPQTTAALNDLFERFEHHFRTLPREELPLYRHYSQQRLHPWVLAAPFAHRTYAKPLGYAGDYAMVDMMLSDPCRGTSLFAQIFNVWLLQQASARGHRARIELLTQTLINTASNAARSGRRAQIYNIGCGPAREVSNFIAQSPISSNVDFTLVDMDSDALEHARESIQAQAARHNRSTRLTFLQRSMRDILRDATSGRRLASHFDFDLVYCAGLFDYLSAPTCRQFIDLGSRSLRPGGSFLCTNVAPSNPNRGSMELLLDWNLIYRDTSEFLQLAPATPNIESRVITEESGTNLFLEITKAHDS